MVSPYTAAMDETQYRESRICRLLGNPVIYQLVVLLDDGGPMTPSHLAKLRTADIVRYDTAGKEVRYWLKHRGETRALLKALEKIIHASSQLA